MRRKTRARIERLEKELSEVNWVASTSRQALFGGGDELDILRRFAHHVNNEGQHELVRPARPQTGLMERVEKLESR